MKRAKGKKILACLMGMCLLAGMLPPQAASAAPAAKAGSAKMYSINLQKDGKLAGIDAPSGTGGTEWKGSRIYLGQLNGKPVLWRVLDESVSEISAKNIMLLMSDNALENRAFHSDAGNAWADSAIAAYLNSRAADGFLGQFSASEQGSIYSYAKSAGGSTTVSGSDYVNPGLTAGEKVFLLSADEASAGAYGLGGSAARTLKSLNGAAASWWLRSGIKDDSRKIAFIDAQGKLQNVTLGNDAANVKKGIVPALYLDTSSILFTTRAVNGKTDFSKVAELTGETEWKLTLAGSNIGMGASLTGGALHERGELLTLNHNSAKAALAGANQISALITGVDGVPLYYGKISADVNSASTGLALPADIPAGSYSLYVFAEQVNGDKLTDYASGLGDPIALTVDTTVTPQITTAPTAGAITFGQTLRDSVLSGGEAKAGSVVVPGAFSWKTPDVVPTVADSSVTEYEVIFTPSDPTLYKAATVRLKLAVQKAAQAPNPPAASITVEYGVTKVSGVSLPQGWSWKPEDAARELAVGANQATAVYQDGLNYENYTASVSIVRNDCAHTGGVATCTGQAICDICHLPYGLVNPAQHGQTELRGAKAATCTEKGHTGDTCCTACGQIVSKGQELAALNHDYEVKVTREPTKDADGIRTYTCKRCGYHYDENMGRHGHYYNNTKILHYVGCVQQGEVEHSCDCGDSYVEITPALGHSYTSAITTKPTTGRAGVKTYTCTRCGYQYTEKLPQLSGGSGNGNKGNGGGSSVSDRLPYVKGDSSLSGWIGIDKAIGKAKDGDTVNIGMNDTMVLPKKTLETLKGKDVTLVLDIGNQMKWSVNGKDITADSLADVNLKVTRNSSGIPADLVKALAGEAASLQFSLVHEGDFGAKMTLQLPVDSDKAGYYSNLFYYNKEGGALEYIASSQMDGKGVAGLEMTHASDYVIIADTKVIDGTKAEEPETPPSQEPEEPQETVPVQEPEPEVGGSSATINVILIIGLVVLCAGILVIVLIRARNKKADWA